MRVCVVGGTGNISTGIVKALLSFGHDVTVFTRGQSESRLPSGVRYLVGDRQDRPAFETAMQAERFDVAIDMICFDAADAESAVRSFRGVKHLIHCSTVATFGGPLPGAPIDETAPLRPVIDYGRGKIAADEILRTAHTRGEVPVTIFKPAQTWGPGGTLVSNLDFAPTWLNRVRAGKPLVVSGDGQTLWSLCHSDDAGVAFAAAVDRTACKGQDYIVTSPRWITWQAYHERINAVLGSKSEIVHVPAATILASPLAPHARLLASESLWNRCYDVSKLRRDIPEFQPAVEFEHGIPDHVAWMDRHGLIGPGDADDTTDRLIAAQRDVATGG